MFLNEKVRAKGFTIDALQASVLKAGILYRKKMQSQVNISPLMSLCLSIRATHEFSDDL